MYLCLHHLHTLFPHFSEEQVDTESTLCSHLLYHDIQKNEGTCTANSCTAVHQQWLVQGWRVLLSNTRDKIDKRHGILWDSMVRPGCVVKMCDSQGSCIGIGNLEERIGIVNLICYFLTLGDGWQSSFI